MRNFSRKRPLFRRILHTISDGLSYIMPFYLIIALSIIIIPFLAAWICLPDAISKPIATIIGAIVTVVVVPILLNQIKRNYETKDRLYEQNKELYSELISILLEILIAEKQEHKKESAQLLNKFINDHYWEMCIYFSEDLIWKILSISREFEYEKFEYKNIIQLVEKCINSIRKEGGLNDTIFLNQNIIEMMRSFKDGKNNKLTK